MRHKIYIFALGLGLSGATACRSEPALPAYPLDGITVFVGFDEPICGGTFGWIEDRLRWLERETGLPASESPIEYYWLREDVYDHCPTGSCAHDNRIYTPIEFLSHELVHGHLAQLGFPRPWLVEGLAVLLEDARWGAPNDPMTPSTMLERTDPLDLSYNSAGKFVGFLRDRFGMPALIELYAELDGADEARTREVFLAVLGEDWDAVEDAYLAGYTVSDVGAINCDFPALAPRAAAWTFAVESQCDDPSTIGPFLGWSEMFSPYTSRSVIIDVPESGTYSLGVSSSALTSVELVACDDPLPYHSLYAAVQTEDVLLSAGRHLLTVRADIAAHPVGTVTLRGPTASYDICTYLGPCVSNDPPRCPNGETPYCDYFEPDVTCAC